MMRSDFKLRGRGTKHGRFSKVLPYKVREGRTV